LTDLLRNRVPIDLSNGRRFNDSDRGRRKMGHLKMLPIIALWISVVSFFSDVVNKDRPLKAEWNLRLEKVWEIDRAGFSIFQG
jgi:hypothetical protein